MADDFVYGRCAPYRATISTEFCRQYKKTGNYECRNCGGLLTGWEAEPVPARPRPESGRPPFGEELKRLMAEKRMDLPSLALADGLSYDMIARWRNGARLPTVGQARALDRALGTTLAVDYADKLRPDGTRWSWISEKMTVREKGKPAQKTEEGPKMEKKTAGPNRSVRLNIFSDRLRQARMAKGLTQKGLSEETGLSAVTVGRYEDSQFLPKPATLAKLAAALDVTPGWLMGDETAAELAAAPIAAAEEARPEESEAPEEPETVPVAGLEYLTGLAERAAAREKAWAAEARARKAADNLAALAEAPAVTPAEALAVIGQALECLRLVLTGEAAGR